MCTGRYKSVILILFWRWQQAAVITSWSREGEEANRNCCRGSRGEAEAAVTVARRVRLYETTSEFRLWASQSLVPACVSAEQVAVGLQLESDASHPTQRPGTASIVPTHHLMLIQSCSVTVTVYGVGPLQHLLFTLEARERLVILRMDLTEFCFEFVFW